MIVLIIRVHVLVASMSRREGLKLRRAAAMPTILSTRRV
jgi:hypothetical protein